MNLVGRVNPTSDLRQHADNVREELEGQKRAWGTGGWTRRRFIAGAGMAGVAALGSQFVTARGAFSAEPATSERTLVVVFLRGAADGLRLLVPDARALGGDYLRTVRGPLVPASSQLIHLPDGWGLNRAMQPLYGALWKTGELAFVPAVSESGISRSHFQAQQRLERGGADTAKTGWLDRVLDELGPGTTFRALASGYTTPLSLTGAQPSISVPSLRAMKFPSSDLLHSATEDAVKTLYRGLGGSLGQQAPEAIDALGTARSITRAANRERPTYPTGEFARSLRDIAMLLKAEAGLQVATVDVGGWDTHTNEAEEFDRLLNAASRALKAFMLDLGPVRRKRVTVVVMTEFGRRVAINGSGGTDHGHGSVMWLLGGGLAGGGVHGKWTTLSKASLDHGDVPAVNNPYDVLSDVLSKRLGVGTFSTVFPGHERTFLNVTRPH